MNIKNNIYQSHPATWVGIPQKTQNMETNRKKYDLSSFDELFSRCIEPQQLKDEIMELVFNYASKVNDYEIAGFKNDMSTLYIIYDAVKAVKEIKP